MIEPDYSSYSLRQLEESASTLDRERFPDRARRLDEELERRRRETPLAFEPTNLYLEADWVEHPTFEGKAREYFGIWIVNLALTVVTLGFYLPWARVRSRRYLYRTTRLAGHGFDYLAEPRRLLVGYLIVGFFALLYFVAPYVNPFLAFAVAGVFFVAMPWLIHKSMRFFLANSAYRNLRFRFAGTLSGAYGRYMLLPFVTALSLGMATPWIEKVRREYFFENVRYGSLHSSARLSTSFFYGVTIFFIAIMLCIGIVAVFLFMGNAANELGDAGGTTDTWTAYFVIAPFYFLMFALGTAFNTVLVNHCWESTSFDAVEGNRRVRVNVHSQLDAMRYAWIVLTNILLAVVTLGLYTPFGIVRLHRYRVSRVWFSGTGSLDDVVATAADDPSAIGESAADAFDFEFGF